MNDVPGNQSYYDTLDEVCRLRFSETGKVQVPG